MSHRNVLRKQLLLLGLLGAIAFETSAAQSPAPRGTPSASQQSRYGTWSASNGRGLILMGTWTAVPDSTGTSVTGTWAITDAEGRARAQGTWSAAKAATQWTGAWRAIVEGREGEYSGTWTALLDANAGHRFDDLFELAVRAAANGTWKYGSASGAWSIRAAPRG